MRATDMVLRTCGMMPAVLATVLAGATLHLPYCETRLSLLHTLLIEVLLSESGWIRAVKLYGEMSAQ